MWGIVTFLFYIFFVVFVFLCKPTEFKCLTALECKAIFRICGRGFVTLRVASNTIIGDSFSNGHRKNAIRRRFASTSKLAYFIFAGLLLFDQYQPKRTTLY
jgi:hypothetical protein